jgi:hypothetical protein
MNRERRTDDGTYPNNVEEARASASNLPPIPIPMTASDCLEMPGELSDGYGPEAQHAYDVLRELVDAAEDFVKVVSMVVLVEAPELERLRKSLEGKPL